MLHTTLLVFNHPTLSETHLVDRLGGYFIVAPCDVSDETCGAFRRLSRFGGALGSIEGIEQSVWTTQWPVWWTNCVFIATPFHPPGNGHAELVCFPKHFL